MPAREIHERRVPGRIIQERPKASVPPREPARHSKLALGARRVFLVETFLLRILAVQGLNKNPDHDTLDS